jgi:AcrR family transcriptional regulator
MRRDQAARRPPAAWRGDSATRARILDAAERLFARDGFDATPTARVATEASVAKGLLFYYFPRKQDLLLALLAERLPPHPLCDLAGIAVRGDVRGSLVRLADRLNLGGHESTVLRTILFREASTHAEVGGHLRTLHQGLIELTEKALDASSPRRLDRTRRRQAADTFVALLLHDANSRRFGGARPDLGGAAEQIARALIARARPATG